MQKKEKKALWDNSVDQYFNNPERGPYLNKQFKYFIKEVLKNVPGEKNYSYIDYKLGKLAISLSLGEDEPGYQIRPALKEMLDKNVSKNSILDLVRVVQSDAIFNLLQVLEGRWKKRGNWGFYFENKDGEPIHKVGYDELSCGFEIPEFIPRKFKKKKIEEIKKSDERRKQRMTKEKKSASKK